MERVAKDVAEVVEFDEEAWEGRLCEESGEKELTYRGSRNPLLRGQQQ